MMEKLSNKQNRLIKYIYKKPKSIKSIYSHFKIDYKILVDLTNEIEDYLIINKKETYVESTISLSHKGEAYRERLRKETFATIGYWITTTIAVLAFIKSFFYN